MREVTSTREHASRAVRRLRVLVVLCPALWLAEAARADTPVPPKTYAEQHRFDEQSGAWVQVAAPIPGTQDGDLDIARQWMAREDYRTALKILKDWFAAYAPESPRYPEALYLKATCYLQTGDYREANDSYESLLNDYPGSPYAEDALSGKFRVAEQYLAGGKRKAWGGLLRLSNYDGGLEIMDDILAGYSDTHLAEMARMAKADYYFAEGEFKLAEEEYAAYAREHPRSRWQPRAALMSARAAMARFAGVKFDESPLIEARERFQQFREQYPGEAEQLDVPVIVDQIDATRADKRLAIGRYYEKTDQPAAAKYYYETILRLWPDTPAASEARSRLPAIDADREPSLPANAPEAENQP